LWVRVPLVSYFWLSFCFSPSFCHFFLLFIHAVMLTRNKPGFSPIAPTTILQCRVHDDYDCFYTIISKRGTLQFFMPKSEDDPRRASAFLRAPPHERQHRVTYIKPSRYTHFWHAPSFTGRIPLTPPPVTTCAYPLEMY
jgi:hypothetical protein